MFGDVGFAYVYFAYGMHFCFNVVAKDPKKAAGAVLIRAIEPEKGIKVMQKNRGIENLKNLANGPAKLAQAFDITKEHYGVDLTKKSKLYITEGIKSKKIIASQRIGITKAVDKLWNFKITI
jgi:DNA-3-methyladenine glycosylase